MRKVHVEMFVGACVGLRTVCVFQVCSPLFVILECVGSETRCTVGLLSLSNWCVCVCVCVCARVRVCALSSEQASFALSPLVCVRVCVCARFGEFRL